MKKFVLLFLAALVFLFSCANGEVTDENEGDGATTSAENVAAEADDGIVNRSAYEEPEVKDFEKYGFRILENPKSNVFTFHKQAPEEQTGEVVCDAFIARNRVIEDRYNIAISAVFNDAPYDTLRKSIAADDDICDLGFIPTNTVYGLAQIGALTDFNSVNALRLDMPWWDGRITESLGIYGKAYVTAGDITTNDDVSSLTILYNKELYKQLGYENPYQIVSSGKWTMDKMAEMIKGVNRDLNGDGIIDENDRWAMASESLALYYFFFGSGRHYIDKTPEGYAFTLDEPIVRDILEKTFNLLTAEDSVYDLYGKIKDTSVSVYVTLEKMFMDNRLLFNVRLVGDALNLRGMESDFGFLPFPKYDEAQKEYYSWVTFYAELPVMPVTVADREKSGLITEALAFESMFAIREPFYGKLLNAKIARGDEDTEMLNLVLNSKAYDLDGATYSSGVQSGIYEITTQMLSKREFTIASSWEKIKPKAEGNLEKFLQAFE